MKLLVAFVAVCLVTLGFVGWRVWTAWQAPISTGAAYREISTPPRASPGGAESAGDEPEPADARQPDSAAMRAPAPGTEDSAPGGAPAEGDPATASRPVVQGLVRWAADAAGREARRVLERTHPVLREDPDHPGALRDQAAALATLGRWSEAADTQERLVALEPDDDARRFEHAALLIQARRWTDAIAVLKECVRRDPERGPAWFNLAVAHQAQGHLADARAAWDRAIALEASLPALAGRAEVLLDLQEWTAAAADLEQVYAAEPDDQRTVLNLALARWKAGQVAEARALLVENLARHPRHVPLLNRLAEMAWSDCMRIQDHGAVPRNAPAASQATGAAGAAAAATAARTGAASSRPATVRVRRAACTEAAEWCRRSLEIDPEQPAIRAMLEEVTAERAP